MNDQWNVFVNGRLNIESTGNGELKGLAFAVKDVFDIQGYTSGAGNPDWLRTHGPAVQNAYVIDLLLKHGAELKGTVQTDELMYSLNGENFHYGTPINPKAPDRIPGGSSSGSAVAVAAGLVDFSIGTDTGGSVRIPSSYCGIYGFRPTHRAVSTKGVIPLAPSFDTVGWMSRSPQLLLKIGQILIDGQSKEGQFKNIYLAKEPWKLMLEKDKTALLDFLSSEGIINKTKMVKISEHNNLTEWSSAFRILQGLEIWSEHGSWIQKEKPDFGSDIADRFQWASTLKKSKSISQFALREHVKLFMSNLLGEDGVLIIPTAPGIAPLLNMRGEEAEQYRAKTMQLSCIAGLAGLPQITIPVVGVNGLPLGLSFIANQYQDLKLLSWMLTICK
ncbi:amidase [Paenibacillus jamilae]|uniref:Amidase n=1 Tax=Paenibacillus jamilae TaxID=114136 RepID=A0ACC4ZP05_9BACL|nr:MULTISPECIES: amidase [Paenibacillus]AUO09014.1 amidase [Paenibacillus sp. lzh-N1]KTS77466.1 amidase [Paenibacillus jamilae]